WLAAPSEYVTGNRQALAIDEFNYCRDGGKANVDALQIVQDLSLPRSGISFGEDLALIAEGMTPATTLAGESDDDLPTISGAELGERLLTPASKMINLSTQGDILRVRSKLPDEKFAYIYVRSGFTRQELNMVLNSQFKLVSEDSTNVRTVFEFQDENRQKIS